MRGSSLTPVGKGGCVGAAMFQALDAAGARLLGHVQRNPASASRPWPDVRALPWSAESVVRSAWVRAYLDVLGLTGEVSVARWASSLESFLVWDSPAAEDESEDALRAAREANREDDPQRLVVPEYVDWRAVTNAALRRWWDTSENAGDMLAYATTRLSRQALVLLAAACARTALRYVPAGEERPRLAIETAEAWARGEATRDEARAAALELRLLILSDVPPAVRAAARAAEAVGTLTYYPSASTTAAAIEAVTARASARREPRRYAMRDITELVRSLQPFPEW